MKLTPATAGSLLLTLGVVYLGYGVDRTVFWSLFLAFTLAFAGYALLVGRPAGRRFRALLLLGLALRLLLLFAFPRLSDDVYRFLWDGQLILSGENPFAHPPDYYLGEAAAPDPELYDRLNSPAYHSVYPPVAQAVFAVASWMAGGSWAWGAALMKGFLLLAEIATLWLLLRLLARFRLPPGRALLYWLNPLVIVEVSGNLHFEGAMVCFLLLSLYFLTRSRYARAGAAMALSVASKLLPLMLLPFLLKRLWRGPFWRFFLTLGGVLLLVFLPLLPGSGLLDGVGGSLDLYFRKFEFNASLYYLLRAYGYHELGWNQIARFGPWLARLAGLLILFLALADERTGWRSLPARWLAAFVVYLLCATTVHPWYLTVPIALCSFTPWRYPLVWSYLIVLTYASYATVPYREELWLVGLEYSGVFLYFAYERFRQTKKGPHGDRADLML